MLVAMTLAAPAQYQFRTEVNPDGTVTVYQGASCPSGALEIPETIGGLRVTSIGDGAFGGAIALTAAYFEGNAPPGVSPRLFRHFAPAGLSPTTVYYLPGTTDWPPALAGRPTAPWVRPKPTILDFGDRFGPSTSGFSFVISWATNVPVLVEARAELGAGWTPISTNTLTDGWVQFTDPDWASHPARFYRVRGQ